MKIELKAQNIKNRAESLVSQLATVVSIPLV